MRFLDRPDLKRAYARSEISRPGSKVAYLHRDSTQHRVLETPGRDCILVVAFLGVGSSDIGVLLS